MLEVDKISPLSHLVTGLIDIEANKEIIGQINETL